jgi:hypothetical protein
LVLATPSAPVHSAAPQVPAAPTPPPAPPADNFEQKYKTLQGKYNAEVAPLQRKASEQAQQINEMAGQLKSLMEARPAAPTTPQVLGEKDIANFGADLCEMVARVTSQKIAEAVAALEPRFTQLGGQVSSVTQYAAQTAEEQFFTLLNSLVPDWQQINETEPWLKWLGVVDDVYGEMRQIGLDKAFHQLNAARVAKVFNAYKASLPAVPVQESLTNQQTPDTGGGSPPPATPAKPILSQASIQEFYRNKTRGVYVGREAEADSIEAQIDLAVAEGRVR